MKGKYIIILFKNKVRYKIIKNYQTYNNAIKYFDKLIEQSKNVLFETKTEFGKDVNYELALVSNENSKNLTLFKQDDLGRNIKIETNDTNFHILKIEDYKIEEDIFDITKKIKIGSKKVIDWMLKGESLKLLSKLNNKVILQNDLEFYIFSLKTEDDAERFLFSLENYMNSIDKKNILIVNDSSKEQKKYLYKILSENGFSKKMLYRKHTTFSTSK